jgi:hypothetical protein
LNDRLKVFVIIAILGFAAGIIAYAVATYFIPWLITVMPSISGVAPFLVSGIVGAILTVLLVAIWAMLTGKKDYR